MWKIFVLLFCGIAPLSDAYYYYYYPTYMEEVCGQTMYLSNESKNYGYIQLTRSGSYYIPNDCYFTIVARPGEKLIFRIRKMDTYYYYGCSYENLSFNGASHVCGYFSNYNADYLATTTMVLRFYSGRAGSTSKRGFELSYNSYTDSTSCSGSNDFKCTNGRCISKELRCDGIINCGTDLSDEQSCPLSGGAIAGIVCGAVAFVVACIAACFCCCKRKKEMKANERQMRNQVASNPPRTGVTAVSHQMTEYPNPAYSTPVYGAAPVYPAGVNAPGQVFSPPPYEQYAHIPAHMPAVANEAAASGGAGIYDNQFPGK